MPDQRDQNEAPGASPEGAPDSGHSKGPALARPLQEHLAQQLRSTYQTMAEKPAFLGDPAVPTQFEQHLERLEAVERGRQRERIRNQGVEAVKTALEDIAAPLNLESAPGPKARNGDGV